jgi:AcrR family transcriptional regulator
MPEETPAKAPSKSIPAISSRDRILSSAKHLFARNGFENTSTVAIAREAGTSESQLMKHFGSKQGLLSAIFDRGWSSILERIQATQRSAPPSDRLLDVLEAMVIEIDRDPELKELVSLEARRVRKDNRDVLVSRGQQRYAEIVHNLLAEMRAKGEIRADVNLDAIRAAILGMVEGLLRDQVVAKRSGWRADYNFDDIRKVLEMTLLALPSETVVPLKAVNH